MRKAVSQWRGVYEERYRDIRHGVFAHKGLNRTDTDALMAKTNIDEMKSLFGFLHARYTSRCGRPTTTVGNRNSRYRSSCWHRCRSVPEDQ
jgi:hypothetical protein